MNKFLVTFSWTMTKTIEIEAEDKKDAEMKVENIADSDEYSYASDLNKSAEYLDGSFNWEIQKLVD